MHIYVVALTLMSFTLALDVSKGMKYIYFTENGKLRWHMEISMCRRQSHKTLIVVQVSAGNKIKLIFKTYFE